MKIRKFILIIIFILIIFLPFILEPIFKDSLIAENTENREITVLPDFQFSEILEYPIKFEKYFNDNFPFRSFLIKINNVMDYYLFQRSNNSNVLIGKSGWLFYKGENSIDSYVGRDLYTQKELEIILNNLLTTKRNLDKKGIEFVLFIAPNKERVYQEFMPDYYGSPSNTSKVFQIIDVLKNTNINIIYPLEELLSAKVENPSYLFYYVTDTHWNRIGAYVGTQTLLSSLNIYMPKLNSNSVTINEIESKQGDMTKMLNLSEILGNEIDYEISLNENYDVIETNNDYYGNWGFKNENKNYKLLMFRDSFCENMTNFIAQYFNESNFVHRNAFSNNLSLIDTYNPDIFVFEIVERSTDVLLDYRYD